MPQLIINADDFGLTDGVCQAIVELGQAGAVSSTTAMMGVPEALPRLSRYWGQLAIPCGVHLHVTYGAPVSAAMRTHCARRWDGHLPRARSEIDFSSELLMEECRAQVELFTQHFGRPSHFDTHHAFHRDPRYRPLLLSLAKEYGVPLRGGDGDEDVVARTDGVPESVVLKAWSNTGWDTFDDGLAALREVIALAHTTQHDGVWELVCHPGYCDDTLRQITTLNTRRELEREILRSPEVAHLWQQCGVQLVSFEMVK